MNLRTNDSWDFNGAGEMLLVDKPLDWTSFHVVKKVRFLFQASKVGHAGTLDPKATGLLIVCTGKKTKTFDQFVGLEKEYIGTFELGIRTPSYDTETEIIERKDFSGVTLDQLKEAASRFVGKQLQKPPMYSAAKYNGKPLYKFARKGRTVERQAKEIEITQFEIVSFALPMVEFRVVCSKGTYIRSLVDDLGQVLNCGAVLKSLRRTRIGGFHVNDALSIEELERLCDRVRGQKRLLNEDCLPT